MNSTSRGGDSASATAGHASSTHVAGAGEKSYFETQREAMVHEISISLETVLQNINKLNRALEGVIAVGNEFSSVEALWSQFENVMGHANAGEQEQEEDQEENEKDGEEEGGVGKSGQRRR